jgi:hypothetical protein
MEFALILIINELLIIISIIRGITDLMKKLVIGGQWSVAVATATAPATAT